MFDELMTTRNHLLLLLFAVSATVYFPFSQWIATTQIGTTAFLWGQAMYVLPLHGGRDLFASHGCRDLLQTHAVLFNFLFAPGDFADPMLPCWAVTGRKIRMAGMESCGRRAQPLITAIGQYEIDHDLPPAYLDDLVPDYLPNVPSTGMMAYPEFDYHSGVDAEEEYAGNSWALSIFTPNVGINFDRMLYFPNQNYPDEGYGGWLEMIGDWAYVHE